MSRKDALDCWVNTCPPNTIHWKKMNLGSQTAYDGLCTECGVYYEIGVTIGGGMITSHEHYEKIQELNK